MPMKEIDLAGIETALQLNPAALAEAEGHLQKGLMILSREIGLSATRNLVSAVLDRLDGEMPTRRTH